MTDQSKDVLTAEHAPAIGELIIAMSRLESVITDLISVFSGAGIFSIVMLVQHQQISSKIQNLLALARAHFNDDPNEDAPETKPIIDKISKAADLAEYRNGIVHAYWSVGADGTVRRVRFSARGRFRRTREVVAAGQIRERADEARDLTQWLAGLRDQLLETHKRSSQPQ